MKKSVAVLMSTYNGAQWISQQLDSLITQIDVMVSIFIRDDGSKDETVEIIEKYRSAGNKIFLIDQEKRKNLGPAESFMYLIDYVRNIPEKFDYYAFCDQDDVWLPDKLSRAIERLRDCSKGALYFSKKTIVDKDLNELHIEDYIPYADPILHSLRGSNAYGCTFVFDQTILNSIKKRVCGYHDAWIFRTAVWCGFDVVYDPESRVLYRQHGNNSVGAKEKKRAVEVITDFSKWKSQMDRFRCINLDSQVIMHKAIYDTYSELYPGRNMELLKQVVNYRYDFATRIKLMNNPAFYKYGWKDNLKWKMRILENRL